MVSEAALEREPFQAVVGILIPGIVGTFPGVVLAPLLNPKLLKMWTDYQVECIFFYLVAVVVFGMIFEDLGSRIEVNCFDPTLSVAQLEEWDKFLQLETEPTRYGSTYLERIVIRFKFELNMVPACSFAFVSSLCAAFLKVEYGLYFLFATVLYLGLALYLFLEAQQGHKLLAKTRTLLLTAPPPNKEGS